MIKNKTDFFLGLGIIAFMAFVWTHTFKLPQSVRMVPRFVLGVSIMAGAGISIQSLFRKDSQGERHGSRFSSKTAIEISLLVFSIVMLLLVRAIGMYVSLFLILTAISLVIVHFQDGLTLRNGLSTVFYDAMVGVVVYLLFHVVLRVSTPSGVLI